jgi:hypothetical protein
MLLLLTPMAGSLLPASERESLRCRKLGRVAELVRSLPTSLGVASTVSTMTMCLGIAHTRLPACVVGSRDIMPKIAHSCACLLVTGPAGDSRLGHHHQPPQLQRHGRSPPPHHGHRPLPSSPCPPPW